MCTQKPLDMSILDIFKSKPPHPFVGRRIKCIEMKDDDEIVIPSGTIGTIRHIGGGVINVKWENGRDIGIIEDVDRFEYID